ncbi:MAG: MXAN_5808 family serine peptidase [Polyangiaceae bacterium]
MSAFLKRMSRVLFVLMALGIATIAAAAFGAGGLWRGFEPALARGGQPARPYDLTRLEAVNATLDMIRKHYVEPDRVKPRTMLLSALNFIQRDVAQVMVRTDDKNEVTVTVDNQKQSFRIDDVQGPWDVAARLREIFGFLQKNLKGTDVDLRELEYTACNGMLHTLDPHSTFLSPDGYKEMNAQTSGAFGGLGIVISIRDQQLTVMKPMPDTPASRADLRRFDRIVKIENESTTNMPLDDAVKRLRGDPGTKVTIWVTREGEGGWTQPKAIELTREKIKVYSVDAHLLDDNVGYIKLKSFQASSMDEIDQALTSFKEKGALKGLVLDLRGNPGGLLDQAVKIADRFVEEGTIVATVGASEGREERKAATAGTEPAYPIVVLVSGNSASASEILSGALKNLDRAVIVGQQTFGKGSVQLIFPDVTEDSAALKLTISQYLTPGDVSIQGVGVTPDIELDAMTVDEREMDLTVQKDGTKERDLSAVLQNDKAAPPGKPTVVVRYQYKADEKQAMRDSGNDEDDFVLDFPIKFARELTKEMPEGQNRPDQVKAALPFIEKVKGEELDKIASELSKLRVDWAAAPANAKLSSAADLEVKLETDKPGNEVKAGETMDLKVTVKNKGAGTIYRLRANTESENGNFDSKELVFGRLGPGEERTAHVPLGYCDSNGPKDASTKKAKETKRVCKIPMDANERADGVAIKFEAEGGEPPPAQDLRTIVHALPRPRFKYSYEIVDDRGGNGDGKLQGGEKASLYLTVKNVGAGRSYDTVASIVNLSGDDLTLHKGRFDISNMEPGDVKRLTFTFDVASKTKEQEVTLSLSVSDRDVRETASQKLHLPLEAPNEVAALDATKQAGEQGAMLLESPKSGAHAFGKLSPGTAVSVVGHTGSFDKVVVEGDRFAFVATSELAAGGGTPAVPLGFEDVYSHAPPELELHAAALSTTSDTIELKGTAVGSDKLIDLYGFVGERKFFYQSNKDGADPKSASFDVSVPLRPGVNIIYVVARESPDSTTRRVVVVRKDGADGSILATPKNEESLEDALE